nr:hypothetical protein [Wolbachia endosymbiont of Onchocerca gibsoni]
MVSQLTLSTGKQIVRLPETVSARKKSQVLRKYDTSVGKFS